MENQNAGIRNDTLLSPEQMAAILGVKVSWLYRQTMLHGQGSIPRIRLGKYLRFEKEAVLNWVRESQVEG